MHLNIDSDQLWQDIRANGNLGSVRTDDPEANARTVLAGSKANEDARDRLISRMQEIGLSVSVDAVGNILGEWYPEGVSQDADPVVTGSHLDSVPSGGIFDGPLGVYGALEAVRAVKEGSADATLTAPLGVVCFTEEEGARFSDGLLGSSVASGARDLDATLAKTDDDGVSLGNALESIGYQGEGRLDVSEWAGWYELHIEQDTTLETAAVPVGVVTTITGITRCDVTITGQANHAGATGMTDRTDALAAASEFILDVETAAAGVAAEDSDTAVGTVGSLSVSPGATNVVPGQVTMGVDIRDVDADSIETIVTAARESLARLETDRNVDTTITRPFDLRPVEMSSHLRDAAHKAGEAAGVSTHDLHSGAAHDSMNVVRHTDAALLFAPSRDGISHNPREWTDPDDCADATRVLAGSILETASR